MLNPKPVPQLNSIFTKALYDLERRFIEEQQSIAEWFAKEWQKSLPPVYGSVDLRNAGFKLAPIDMNLFPAGFNNLNQDFLSISIAAAKSIVLRLVPNTKKILIIPESHTRNLFYWANIKTLETILQSAGFETKLGTLNPDVSRLTTIPLSSHSQINLHALERTQNRLHIEDFIPDVVLLNNDLSAGIPSILQNIAQPILPPAELGWSQRLKSNHFQYYTQVVKEFAEFLDFDPWLIDPLFKQCGEVDFMQQEGMECVNRNVVLLFAEIEKKYRQYNITAQPFIIIKANAGTYGMAVMTIRNRDELSSLNRKQRTRMSTTKGGQRVTSVIIQEGVYTFESYGKDQEVAEPVVYLWGDRVVGGFYRVHKDRGVDENLNAPGMRFEPLAFSESCDQPNSQMEPQECKNRFYIYGIIAKLSMLAAGREIKDQKHS